MTDQSHIDAMKLVPQPPKDAPVVDYIIEALVPLPRRVEATPDDVLDPFNECSDGSDWEDGDCQALSPDGKHKCFDDKDDTHEPTHWCCCGESWPITEGEQARCTSMLAFCACDGQPGHEGNHTCDCGGSWDQQGQPVTLPSSFRSPAGWSSLFSDSDLDLLIEAVLGPSQRRSTPRPKPERVTVAGFEYEAVPIDASRWDPVMDEGYMAKAIEEAAAQTANPDLRRVFEEELHRGND